VAAVEVEMVAHPQHTQEEMVVQVAAVFLAVLQVMVRLIKVLQGALEVLAVLVEAVGVQEQLDRVDQQEPSLAVVVFIPILLGVLLKEPQEALLAPLTALQ
jgi:hypothetical protein